MSAAKVIPGLQVLKPDEIESIHGYSLKILENAGIKVESEAARKIYGKSGAVRIKGDIVHIDSELVNHAIQSAPSNITIHKRDGTVAFTMGSDQQNDTYFGLGVTNTHYQEVDSKKVGLFTRSHMKEACRLGEILENYEMVSTPGIPSDISPAESDLYSSLDMYANTQKPLVLLVSGNNMIDNVFDLLEHLHGDIGIAPFCIPYVNPITPLVLNSSTSDKIIASINRNLPVIFSNYSMYGATSPATPAGTLALLNAELLAGLVFCQLVKEGSKVILGSLPAAFNMSGMGSQYTPQSYLINLACAEMMKHYEIPHCGTSGSNNGRGADLSAASNLWLNHLSSVLGKVGCVPFVGGNFDSTAFSSTMAVMSDYIIGEARQFAAGFSLDDDAVNLEEIYNVGHGGSFFTSGQTLELISEKPPGNELWPTMSLEDWKQKGMPTVENELIELTREILNKSKIDPPDYKEIIQKGEYFIKNLAAGRK